MADKLSADKDGIITDKTELSGLLKLLEPIKSFGLNKIAELSATVVCYFAETMGTKCYDELPEVEELLEVPEMMCYDMTPPGEFGTDDDGGDDDGDVDFDTDDDDDDFDELFGPGFNLDELVDTEPVMCYDMIQPGEFGFDEICFDDDDGDDKKN